MEAELQQILDQVSHLQRHRLTDHVCACRLPSPEEARQVDVRKEEEQEKAPRPCRTLPPLCSIPRKLVVSPSLGGAPVTPQLTQNLRQILFGGTFRVFGYEWRKLVFRFREQSSESFALKTDEGGAQAVQMIVQARIIKHFLFSDESRADGQTQNSLCEVGRQDQERALAAALTDSLWLAGQETRAIVTLVTKDYCITPQLDYKLDTFTERLQLFTFYNKDDTRKFIMDHILCFTEEGSHGVILFLYSLICSRSVDRLKDDLDSTTSHLLHVTADSATCHQALLNLLLTGRACPHVFNGTVSCGDDGRPLERPLQGILTRSDIGYLHWSQEQMERNTLPQVGSALRTPLLPLWLCRINSTFSVLFSENRSLLSDWRTERHFQLVYLSGRCPLKNAARVTVDTRSNHQEASSSDTDTHHPALDMTIRTRWTGAVVDWNGTQPFY